MKGTYKSPKHKLLSFFERSRDAWKAKAMQAKADIKNLNCKLRYHQDKHNKLKRENDALKSLLKTREDSIPQKKNAER